MIDPTVLQARRSAKVIEGYEGKVIIYEEDDHILKGHVFIGAQPRGFEDNTVILGSGVGIPTIKFCAIDLNLKQAEKAKKDLELAISIVKQCSQTRESQLRLHEDRKRGAESQIKFPDHAFLKHHQKTYDDAVRAIERINGYWDSLEEGKGE